MNFAGIPLWAIVLVACVMAPFAVQLWVQFATKRAMARTRALLMAVDPTLVATLAAARRRIARERRGEPAVDEVDEVEEKMDKRVGGKDDDAAGNS